MSVPSPQEIKRQADVVMQMDMFRLMRTGDYTTAKALWIAIKEVFPEADDDNLKENMRLLLRRIS